MAKICIVGSGLVGRAWAISFARAGNEVSLWDQESAAVDLALTYIAEVLQDLARNKLLHDQSAATVLRRIAGVADLAEALAGAIHVQENTPEHLPTKIEVFGRLDPLTPPGAVIASSSSGLLPSGFTEALAGRQRCLVAHPINPPYLVPAVEVVPAPWTSAAAMEQTRALLQAAGQAPIMMKRELDGFIMNRMQGALLEEAFRLVAEGYASVEDVDIGIREGLALRWSFMGPFETIDLNAPAGIKDYAQRYQPMYEKLFSQMQHRVDWLGDAMAIVEPERRVCLGADELAARQKWRDRRLMALAVHKMESDKEYGK